MSSSSTAPLASLLQRLRRDVQRARGGCGTDSDDDDDDEGGVVAANPPPPLSPSWPRLASELLCLLREYPGGVADAVIRTHVAYVLASGGAGRDGAAGAEEEGDEGDAAAEEEEDDDDENAPNPTDPLLEPLAAVPDRRGGNFRRPGEGKANDLNANDPRAWVVVSGNDDDSSNANANANAKPSSPSSAPAWLRLRRAATLAECLSEAARRSGPTERPMLLHARVERVSVAAGGRGGGGGAGGGAAAAPLPPPPPVLWLSDGNANGASSAPLTAMFVHTWHIPLLHAPSYLTNAATPLLSTAEDDDDDANPETACRVRCSVVALKRFSLPTDMPPLMPPAAMAVELGPQRFDRDVVRAGQARWLRDAVRWALEEELGGGGGRGGGGGGGKANANLIPPAGVELRGWVLARVASVSGTERGSGATAGAASRTWTTRVVRVFGGGGGGEASAADDDNATTIPLLLADAREALGDALLPGETIAVWCPRLLRAPPGVASSGPTTTTTTMLCFAEDAAPLNGGGGGSAAAATVSHVIVRGPEAADVLRCVAAKTTMVKPENDDEEGEGEQEDEASRLVRSLRSAPVLPLDSLRRLVDGADDPSLLSSSLLPRGRLVALGVVSGLRLAPSGGGQAPSSSSSSSSSSSLVQLRADLLDPQTNSSVPLSLSLRRDGRLLADLRDGHALLLCGARLVVGVGGGALSAPSSSPTPTHLEWAEAWSGRADRAARGCDAQDLCAMPAALSTARVREIGGWGAGSSSSSSLALAALLSLPVSAPRPLFAVVRGLRLRALRAVVCRVHAACGRRVEALSAADMMGCDGFSDEEEDGGGGGAIIGALSLADKAEETEQQQQPQPPPNPALADWWKRRQGGRKGFRVVLERAGCGGGSDDDEGSGDDGEDDGDEDRVCSSDEDEENKAPAQDDDDGGGKPKKNTSNAAPLAFFSCAFCACELAVSDNGGNGQSSSSLSRAYRDDGLKGARMLLEDDSLAAPLAADGMAWRAALGGVPAARAAAGGRAARRACAAAAEAFCSGCSSAGGQGCVTWDALMYWREGEWRVAAMQVGSGVDGWEEEEGLR